MTVQSAAIKVLRGAGKPLHAKEITEQIIAAGLWKSEGKTPEATVSARLYSDIKNKGDESAFAKVGPQTFALRDSTVELKDADEANASAADDAPKSLPINAGFSFTDCAQKVLEEFGGKKPMHYKAVSYTHLTLPTNREV